MTTASEILLVDDNPADLDLTIDALAQSPWRTNVTTVCDGSEAMDYLRREGKYASATRPHLVLLDLNLPRKDGRAVLAEMKSNPALRRIPVVIFSTSQATRSCGGTRAACTACVWTSWRAPMPAGSAAR